MLSSWISHQLFEFHDSQKLFEEMDREQLEVLFLEHTSENDRFATWQSLLVSSGIIAGAVGFCISKFEFLISNSNSNLAAILKIFGVGITVAGGTVAVGRMWWRRKMGELKRAIEQMERTKRALKRRKQIYFSISNRLPASRNPLITKACRITVQSIDSLVRETKGLLMSKESRTCWIDLYTPEMKRITAKRGNEEDVLEIENESEKEEDIDFEVVFETLIAMFKLHASEYSRFLIADFLTANGNKCWKKFNIFTKLCDRLKEQRWKLEEIEKLALKGGRGGGEYRKNQEKLRNSQKNNNQEIEWKQQLSIAMEAILEGLQSDQLNRNEVEAGLRRALLIVGSSESMGGANNRKDDENGDLKVKIDENGGSGNEEVKVFEKGKGERTDVDMMFEGTSLSEAEKKNCSGIGRDVLLDGSEARKHEKSLFGELEMVLEPRRNDFRKREKKALAQFYGVPEDELEERERKEHKEQNFEAYGEGDGLDEPEVYDWRKEMEENEGIHQQSDNLDFLEALAARRVKDDVIE